jgi:hypothetical protein
MEDQETYLSASSSAILPRMMDGIAARFSTIHFLSTLLGMVFASFSSSGSLAVDERKCMRDVSLSTESDRFAAIQWKMAAENLTQGNSLHDHGEPALNLTTI